MTFQTYSMSREKVEEVASLVAQSVVRDLMEDGKLTEEAANEFLRTKTPLILVRESLYQKLARYIFGKDSNVLKIVIAKLPCPNTEEDEENA